MLRKRKSNVDAKKWLYYLSVVENIIMFRRFFSNYFQSINISRKDNLYDFYEIYIFYMTV